MSEIVGLTAAYVIFGALGVAAVIALMWLAWQILADGVKAELRPFEDLVRSFRRHR